MLVLHLYLGPHSNSLSTTTTQTINKAMLTSAAQTIFTPISSSAEYIGSQIYFERALPTFDIPIGYVGGDSAMLDTHQSWVSLQHSRIGDAGLLMHPLFADLLDGKASTNTAGITHLDLSYCSLSGNAYGSIVAIISLLPNLQTICLTGNNFSSPIKIINNAAVPSINIPLLTSSISTEVAESPTSVEAFLDSLCDHWESHKHLSLVLLDPWLTANHNRFLSIRQRRVSLKRSQAPIDTVGSTGYSSLQGGGDELSNRKPILRTDEGNGLRRAKKKDLLDDEDEDDDDERAAFANVSKAFTTSSLTELLPLKVHNRAAFIKEATTQLLVLEAQSRDMIKTEEMAAIRSISNKLQSSADDAASGLRMSRTRSEKGEQQVSSNAVDRNKQFRKLEAKIRREEERIEEKHRERIQRDKAASYTETLKRLQRK